MPSLAIIADFIPSPSVYSVNIILVSNLHVRDENRNISPRFDNTAIKFSDFIGPIIERMYYT